MDRTGLYPSTGQADFIAFTSGDSNRLYTQLFNRIPQRRGFQMGHSLVLATVVFALLNSPAEAQKSRTDLTELSLEELLEIEVNIVAKKLEKRSESPAAVSVVTQDDIRRSGATSIPEALRLVPGLQVARVDASEWAVSARGFNGVFANKLLVLQDGRSIYTPLFSGVFWDVQGTMIEDIDRIEVIRGPGATLWGANAVNGVINILTKSAKETQGTLITSGGGTAERAFGGIRYGGQIGESAFFRVYGTYAEHDDSALPDGHDADDSWRMGRGGFRVDWDVSDQNLLTFQGDAYGGLVHQVFGTYDPANPPSYSSTVKDDFTVGGGNVQGRWSHTFAPDSELRLQVYYDRTERDSAIFREDCDTFDVDMQHRFPLGERHDVIWGAGYRVTSDEVGNSPTISLIPDRRRTQLFSAFVQDEITLVPDRLRLMLGTKLEHNDFTGFEVQPSGRLIWMPCGNQALWASVSRAVRTPSRAEDDVKFNQVVPPGGLFPGSPLGVATTYGNRDRESEDLLAYEIGYRVQPHETLSLELAAFYNDYDHLRSVEFGPSPTQPPSAPPPPPGVFVPLHVANGLYGETYGVEAAATWEITPWWRLQPAYTFLQMQLHTRSGSTDTTSEQDEGKSPHHQLSLRSSLDLPHDVSLDCILRYVDNLPAIQVSSYVTLDIRLGWRPTKNLELAIVGQNLLDNQHPEFSPSFINTQRTEVRRGVYGKITLRF